MTPRAELTRALLETLAGVPGLRPAAPAIAELDVMAIGVEEEVVEVRVVALTLPLPPLLRHAEAALLSTVDDSPWQNARLRLVVTDIDAAAFG